MKSTCILFPEKGKVTVEHEEVSADNLGDLEVLIRNEVSIISAGTELAWLQSLDSNAPKFPCRPGYGSIGRILAAGSAVKDFKPGDRVFYAGKHASVQRFLHGQNHPWGNLYPVPEKLDPADAAFATMAVIAMTAPNVTELDLGDTVAVFGLGLVGNLAAQLYQQAGARVIALDPVKTRCDLARKVGIETVVDVPASQQLQALKDMTGGAGPAVAVDAVGHSAVIANCVEAAALFGQVVLLGTPRAPFQMNATAMTVEIHRKGLVVRGAHMWRMIPSDARGVKKTVAWAMRVIFEQIASRRLKVRELCSHVIKPEAAPAAYAGLQHSPADYVGVVIDWR